MSWFDRFDALVAVRFPHMEILREEPQHSGSRIS